MSALPRPDLPPGPHRGLVAELHGLHHRAGWPSLRTLAARTGVSHTTVSKVFSAPALPTWGTLELLVEAMDGDTGEFHRLWLTATDPSDVDPAPAPRIAGRRTELDVVRRHLEEGAGLLLVTGEAGMGKTTLVNAAAERSDAFVVTGRCRPLSTPAALMPVSDAFRELRVVDGGSWFDDALAHSPSYVGPALGTLLPELAAAHLPSGAPDFARHRLLSAVSAVLGALGAARPLALVLEDLHWADSATLDLVTLLEDGRARVPLVGTWRTEDPDVSEHHAVWLSRTTRESVEVCLAELSKDETNEQLTLLRGHAPSSQELGRIFARSRGQPLFTEQLTTPGPTPGTLPAGLDRLLAQRLARLDQADWQLARALGIADRPLTVLELTQVMGLEVQPTRVLRGLVAQRLVATGDDRVELRHPLIAEAVRNRLVPGEAAEVHRRVADMLAALPEPPATEIASHWRAAGDAERELTWRLTAGTAAEERFARRESYPEWLRALELWPVSTTPERDRPLGLAELHTRTIEAAIGAGEDVAVVRRHIQHAMVVDVPDQGRAQILLRAGDLECAFGDVDLGLRFLDEAVAISERYPPSSEAGHLLEVRANILGTLGRDADVRADIARGLTMAELIGDVRLERRMLVLSAWQQLAQGDPEQARSSAERARTAIAPSADPDGCLRVAAVHAEVLLAAGAPADDVVAATRDAVEQADLWGFEGLFADFVFASLAAAHLRAGDVKAAADTVTARATGRHGRHLTWTRTYLYAVQIAQGALSSAIDGLAEVVAVGNYASGSVLRDHIRATALLWAGRPEEATTTLDRAIAFVAGNDLARESAHLLATRARAAADVADRSGRSSSERRAEREQLVDLERGLPVDPFGPDGIGADRGAHQLVWVAELARLDRRDPAEAWARAATAWDTLHRPQDAAYCQWRAAQAALREGQGTVAARLLHKAAKGAVQHVPLAQAIARTAAQGG